MDALIPTATDFAMPDYTPDTTYLIPLQQGVIAINGPDAAKFLQGQVTCDVRELAEQKALLGAQCNLKGRMLLCFRAVQTTAEQILLRVHPGLVSSGMASLGKYIVFSKAKLADISEHYHCVGLYGPQATAVVNTVFGISSLAIDHWQAAGEHRILRIDDNRYECWLAASQSDETMAQLQTHTQAAESNLWTLLNIRQGLGDITPETLETFTPQAINFQLVNGINFRKGCYTGQEIVARLHYRGTLKRHMYRFAFSLNGQPLPIPGSELQNSDGKNVGEVILAAQTSATSGELLASVVDDERIAIFLANNTEKLSLLELPYAIPTPKEAE